MKHQKRIFVVLAAFGLLAPGAVLADFSSISCWNEGAGVNQLQLVKRCDGSEAYDLFLKKSGSTEQEVYAGNLECRNLDNSGAGTFVSLVHCRGREPGSGIRVLVTHMDNIDWVAMDQAGNLTPRSTGREILFIVSKPGLEFKAQTLNFHLGQCKQVN